MDAPTLTPAPQARDLLLWRLVVALHDAEALGAEDSAALIRQAIIDRLTQAAPPTGGEDLHHA
jgi:hypothetical protein